MNIRYRVELNGGADATHVDAERWQTCGPQGQTRPILLAADAGVSDEAITSSISVGGSLVYRTKRRFVEGNLELALSDATRPGAPRKLSGKETALLVATACSSPPEGHSIFRLARWSG